MTFAAPAQGRTDRPPPACPPCSLSGPEKKQGQTVHGTEVIDKSDKQKHYSFCETISLDPMLCLKLLY